MRTQLKYHVLKNPWISFVLWEEENPAYLGKCQINPHILDSMPFKKQENLLLTE